MDSSPTLEELAEILNIARWPQNTWQGIMTNLGLWCLRHDDPKAAQTLWQFVLTHDPSYAMAHYNLAHLFLAHVLPAYEKALAGSDGRLIPDPSLDEAKKIWQAEYANLQIVLSRE